MTPGDQLIGQIVKASRVQTINAPLTAPTPRVGSASTVMNNTIYLFSGRGGIAMAPIDEQGQLWSYKVSPSQWTLISPSDKLSSYPEARSYHTMANDGRNKIFVHAGCPEKGRLGDLWAFDIRNEAWQQLANAPDPPRGGTSIAFCAGKLYRMNGFDGEREQGGNLDVYDPDSNSWSTMSYVADGQSGPEARSVSTLLPLSINSKSFLITLFGEHDPSSLGHAGAGKMLDSVWIFDIESHSWTRLDTPGNAPQARGWFDADVLGPTGMESELIVHGGLAEDNTRLGDVWRLSVKIS